MSQVLGAESVQTRDDFVKFCSDLAQSLAKHPDQYPNADLPSFLEALSGWVRDMDGYYTNSGQVPQAQPSWRNLAEMMVAALVYE